MGAISTSLFLVWSVLSIGSTAAPLNEASASGHSTERGWRGGNQQVSNSLQDVLKKAHEGPLFDYPTSFTQDIFVRPLHSHNDYWRPVPFYTALSYGAVSIEADVWLYDDTLYVGHHPSALTAKRTFDALYINPILDVLKKQNPSSQFKDEKVNGVWDTASGQTLYLFVDIKTEGRSTWKKVLESLEPLRKAGYLSTANETTFTSAPITIIGTGATPLDLVTSVSPRHYFYDGPLATLNTTSSEITALISPIASTNFEASFGEVKGDSLNATQLELLRGQVDVAHAKGIQVRYWNQPTWPISTRNGIWRQQIEVGVDLLNVDDLKAASGIGYDW